MAKSQDKQKKRELEEMRFIKKTEAAWKKIEEGKSSKMDFNDFIEELKKW